MVKAMYMLLFLLLVLTVQVSSQDSDNEVIKVPLSNDQESVKQTTDGPWNTADCVESLSGYVVNLGIADQGYDTVMEQFAVLTDSEDFDVFMIDEGLVGEDEDEVMDDDEDDFVMTGEELAELQGDDDYDDEGGYDYQALNRFTVI
jgi:hypothetical protein